MDELTALSPGNPGLRGWRTAPRTGRRPRPARRRGRRRARRTSPEGWSPSGGAAEAYRQCSSLAERRQVAFKLVERNVHLLGQCVDEPGQDAALQDEIPRGGERQFVVVIGYDCPCEIREGDGEGFIRLWRCVPDDVDGERLGGLTRFECDLFVSGDVVTACTTR